MFLHRVFVSSLCIQKWKENVRTAEVLVKQGCNESIKNRKEKKTRAIFRAGFLYVLTHSQLCCGPLGICLFSPQHADLVWPPGALGVHSALEFTCQEVRGHLEEAMTSWYEDRLPKLLQSFFFLVPFFSLPFCLPLA